MSKTLFKQGTHYSQAMNLKKLNAWAERKAHELVPYFRDQKIDPVFCYTGMSGISHVTALTSALVRLYPRFRFGMTYVRKHNEESHGSDVEYRPIKYTGRELLTGRRDRATAVFVDDFIDGGHTFKRVMGEVENKHGSAVKPSKYCIVYQKNCGTIASRKLGLIKL